MPGELTAATVNVSAGIVYGAYLLQDGRSVIATNPLTQAELAAYQRHPDTFFGVFLPRKGGELRHRCSSLTFFMKHIAEPRRRDFLNFLESLSGAADIEQLRQMRQEELAVVYAERCTYAALSDSKPASE